LAACDIAFLPNRLFLFSRHKGFWKSCGEGRCELHPSIDLGFIEIPVYTAFVAVGVVSGLATAYFFLRAYSRRVYSLPVFLDAAVITFAFAWVGARAYHVAGNWNYYSARQDEIMRVDAGGLAMRGAFMAGFLGLALFARVRHLSFWRFADAAALGLAIGQAVGWVGALIWGSNYGAVSDSPLAMDLPNIYGIVQSRLPLQHAEIGLFAIMFLVLLYVASQRPEKGRIFTIYLLVTSVANFVLGYFRGDESAFFGPLRVDQVFDAAFAAVALAVLALRIAGTNTRMQVADAK
jgi:phosphatidylglycerol:prolipoprotein diacylglycerol transferase